jgi:hypothetical protein
VDFARAHTDRVAVLHGGIVTERGPAAEVLSLSRSALAP